jgi:tetratricopeptide (TPR) repeat protein
MNKLMNKLIVISILISSAFCPFAWAERSGRSAFDLGKQAYENGRYGRALDLFSQAINTATDPAARDKAFYYQGMVLFELGYYYSAYISFRNVLLTGDEKNKEAYEKAIKNAVIITDRLNMVDRLGKILENLPPSYIPSSVNSLVNYAIGVYAMKTDQDDKANSRLKSVIPESNFYTKSLFNLGVLATKRKDYKEAIYFFSKVVELTRGKRDMFAQNELARLDLARSVYSAGDIEKSIEVYSQFLSSSPHWLTVLLEASWPLMRVNDTTVSLGNLHTVLSPFYREDLVGEGYLLRATILFSLCKYEEMRRTLSQFFTLYDPVARQMQTEETNLGTPESFFHAYVSRNGMSRAFYNFAKRDEGIANEMKVIEFLTSERRNLARYSRNEQIHRMMVTIEETQKALESEIGATLHRLHKRKLNELMEQREQANYLKVEIVTGEKEMIEGQKGLPPKRLVDVETSVSAGYHFWPFSGEYWEDELGTYVYTTESACVN